MIGLVYHISTTATHSVCLLSSLKNASSSFPVTFSFFTKPYSLFMQERESQHVSLYVHK